MSTTTDRTDAPTDAETRPIDGVTTVEEVRSELFADSFSPAAVDQLRAHVDEASGGGNRFVWFLIGVVTTLVAGAIAAVAFLAVSDDDDDGVVDLDVPTVDVGVDG